MTEKGVSPRDLAKQIKISESTIYRTIRAERSPTLEEIEMFAAALNVPIGKILKITDDADEKTTNLENLCQP